MSLQFENEGVRGGTASLATQAIHIKTPSLFKIIHGKRQMEINAGHGKTLTRKGPKKGSEAPRSLDWWDTHRSGSSSSGALGRGRPPHFLALAPAPPGRSIICCALGCPHCSS